jgi:PGF-pre-PGF domain-containing protein
LKLHSTLAGIILLLCSAAVAADVYEIDNSFANASWLYTNATSQTHTYDGSNDVDYLKFNVTAGRFYEIITNSSDADTVLTIFWPDQTTVFVENDDNLRTNAATNSRVLFQAPTNNTFYARVTEFSGDAGGTYIIQATQLGILTTVIVPNSSVNVTQNDNFTVTATTYCTDGPCLNTTITLDPEEPAVDPEVQKEIDSHGSADVIVTFKDKPSKVRGVVKTHEYKLIPAIAAEVTQSGLNSLEDNPSVESVTLNREVHAFLSSSLPSINAGNISRSNVTVNGTGVTVCVIDTGVNYQHPDFGSCSATTNINDGSCRKVIGGVNYCPTDACNSVNYNPTDNNGHGTHVAATVAGMNTTYPGVAPGANIVAMKVLNSAGSGSVANVIAAIDWCVANASTYNISVISLSLGSGVYNGHCDRYPEAAAVAAARAAGIIVTIAAGNDFAADNQLGVSTPGCAPSATTVGATYDNTTFATFSKRDVTLDVVAPGVSITAANYLGGYITYSGTSMATPHVAGLAALIIQYNKALYNRTVTPASIEQSMKTSGVTSVDTAYSNLSVKRIDALDALQAKGIVPMTIGARPFYTSSQNPVTCYLASGENCTVNWTVHATEPNGTFTFFTITENEYSTVLSNTFDTTVNPLPPNHTNVSTTVAANTSAVLQYESVMFSVNVSSNDTENRTNVTINQTFNASAWNYTNSTGNAVVANDSIQWTVNLTANSTMQFNSSFIAVGESQQTVLVEVTYNNTTVANASTAVTVTVPDTTVPVVQSFILTVRGSTSAAVALVTDEAATCKYGFTDDDYSTMTLFDVTTGTTHESTLNGLTPSTDYTVYARCTDASNNTHNSSVLVTFTTSAAPRASGGGGGGGGGGAPRPASRAEENSHDIHAGETETIRVHEEALPITEVTFAVKEDVTDAKVSIENRDQAPKKHRGPVYSYIEVVHEDSLQATDVTLSFTVSKAWLLEQKALAEDVVLYRLDGDWGALRTEHTGSTATDEQYTAHSPGFSYFAIAIEPTVQMQETIVTIAEPMTQTESAAEETIVEPSPAVSVPSPVQKKQPFGRLLLVAATIFLVSLVFSHYRAKSHNA